MTSPKPGEDSLQASSTLSPARVVPTARSASSFVNSSAWSRPIALSSRTFSPAPRSLRNKLVRGTRSSRDHAGSRTRGPSFPKKPLFLALAFILGTGLGVGGAVALDMLNSGFSAPKEVEAVLGPRYSRR